MHEPEGFPAAANGQEPICQCRKQRGLDPRTENNRKGIGWVGNKTVSSRLSRFPAPSACDENAMFSDALRQ